MQTFGDRLRELRKEKNLLQGEIAEILNISPSAVGSYERNLREPTYELLITIADYFNVSTDFLLCRSDERLTVETYNSQDTFQLQDLLNDRTVFIGSYELQAIDKERIYNISCGLIFGSSGRQA